MSSKFLWLFSRDKESVLGYAKGVLVYEVFEYGNYYYYNYCIPERLGSTIITSKRFGTLDDAICAAEIEFEQERLVYGGKTK